MENIFIGFWLGITFIMLINLTIRLFENGKRRPGAPRPIPKCKPRKGSIK